MEVNLDVSKAEFVKEAIPWILTAICGGGLVKAFDILMSHGKTTAEADKAEAEAMKAKAEANHLGDDAQQNHISLLLTTVKEFQAQLTSQNKSYVERESDLLSRISAMEIELQSLKMTNIELTRSLSNMRQENMELTDTIQDLREAMGHLEQSITTHSGSMATHTRLIEKQNHFLPLMEWERKHGNRRPLLQAPIAGARC